MSLVLTLLLGIVIVLAITVATGYFVAQEFAYMAVDRSALKARAADGDSGAQGALDVTRRTSFMLSGAQLGITVTGLLVGYVAEPLIGRSLGELLGLGGLPSGFSIGVGAFVAIALSTIIQMVLGELFPKNYAIARPEPVAVRLAWSTRLYLAVFGPLIKIFDAAAERLLKALGIEPVHDVDQAADSNDLVQMVRTSRDAGDLSPRLSLLLERILDFPDRSVSHALMPRSRVDVLSYEDATVGEAWTLMATGHTRYPVTDGDDRIQGVLNMIEVLDPDLAPERPIVDFLREPLVVSEHGTLTDALSRMLYERQQLACVVDEFGTFIGILTIEDLAEEIVGEITDEHDEPDLGDISDAGDGHWEVDGDAHLDEVERHLGVTLPEGDYETVSGLISAAHGSLPEVGTIVEIELPRPATDEDEPARVLVAEVLEVDLFVPSRVSLRLPVAEEAS
ncbi:hemolysin family protein [Alteromonas gracilis]